MWWDREKISKIRQAIEERNEPSLTDVLSDIEYLFLNSFDKKPLNDQDIIFLSAVLKHNNTVTKIYLGCNLISDKGLMVLSEAIKNNENIKEFDICENNITSVGLAAFL